MGAAHGRHRGQRRVGWLTGPSTFIDHTKPNATPQHGNYPSVWRRQADGTWRVFIDMGSEPPQAVPFEPGFTRFPFGARYTGEEPNTKSAAALLAADKALNARIAAAGSSEAYGEVTTVASRLHRSGLMPPIGAAAIRAWMKQHAPTMTALTGAADAARSGDLGYSYGAYDVKAAPPQHGAYVRVWQRDSSGKWLLVADVVEKFKLAAIRDSRVATRDPRTIRREAIAWDRCARHDAPEASWRRVLSRQGLQRQSRARAHRKTARRRVVPQETARPPATSQLPAPRLHQERGDCRA